MANVKKCDHCGTYYDKSSEGYSYVRLGNNYWNEDQYNVIDLCPECMGIFESWLRGGVEFASAKEEEETKMSTIVDSHSKWVIDKYPTECDECPFFSEEPYHDNAYQGYYGVCQLGYMEHGDTREFSGRGVRWPNCDIEHNGNVSLDKH